jgi:hypothetical protein
MNNLSPRGCRLEVCGDVERAQDVVREDELLHEAKIERIENHCARLDIVENNNSTSQANRNEETLPSCSNNQAVAGPIDPTQEPLGLPGVMPMAPNQVPVAVPTPVPASQSTPVEQVPSQNIPTQGSQSQFPETPAQVPSSNQDQTCIPTGNQVAKSQYVVENGPQKSDVDRKVEETDVDNVRKTSNDSVKECSSHAVQNVASQFASVVPQDNGVAVNSRTLSESDSKLNCATDTQFTGNDLKDKDKDKKNNDNDKKNPARDLNESVNSSGNPPKLVNGSASPNAYRKLPPQSDISVQPTQGLKKSDESKDALGQKPDKLVVNGLVNHLGNGDILMDVEKQIPAVVATVLAEDVIKPTCILKENKDLSSKIESNCKSKGIPNDVGLQNGYLSDIASPNPAEEEKVGENKVCIAKTYGKPGSDAALINAVSTSVDETNEIKYPQTIPCAQDTNSADMERTNSQSQTSPHLENSNTNVQISNPHSKVTNPNSEASNSSVETSNSSVPSVGTTDLKMDTKAEASVKHEQCDETQNKSNSDKMIEEAMEIDGNPPSNSSVASKPNSLDLVLKDIHDIIEDKSVEEMLGVDSKTAGPVCYNEIKIGELASNTRTPGLPIVGQPPVKMDATSVPYPSVQHPCGQQVHYQQAPPIHVGNPHPPNIPTPKSSGANKRKDEEKITKSRKKARSRASSIESRRSSNQSIISSVGTEYMCEWANCRK